MVHACNKNKFKNKNLFLFGLAGLLWFIFRTGTKPSRIVYPCQRAALTNSSMLMSIFIPLSLASVLTKTKQFMSKKGTTIAMLIIVASMVLSGEQFLGGIQLAGAVNPNQELKLPLEPRKAAAFPASNIFVVNGRADAHISELISLMGSNGLIFYKSRTSGVNQGPNGLIARDDVVLIKINCQWEQRGGTNTDVLKELIQAIVNHPDGFVGEIVVADNGQGRGSMDWVQSNAENDSQSTQDVVNMFSTRYHVSTFLWDSIRETQVDEYSAENNKDGYILYNTPNPETGMIVSYPKFKTQYGTYISFKYGVWNGTTYEKRLKVINMPVLKSHVSYGVTASLKHYMGVQSQNLGNGHDSVKTGGMGTLMVETGLPTLNIIDAIWVNANPAPSGEVGPSTPNDWATRMNLLLASEDPVALDYWAAKHILVQAARLIGYNDTHTVDPDNIDKSGVDEAFGVWLSLTKKEIIAGGYDATTDENHMNIYVKSETTPPEFPPPELPDAMPPTISILSPKNKRYAVTDVPLAFTVSELTLWMGYSLDGQANVTIAGNTTLTGLYYGTHNIVVYAKDSAGNIGSSGMVYFAIGTLPSISILSPENKTYDTTDIPLTFTVTETVSWIGYSLDGQANVTITGNKTITGLPYGSHSLVVYAIDIAGNPGTSETIYFRIKTQQSEPFATWVVAAVVAIIVIIAVAAVVIKKRSK